MITYGSTTLTSYNTITKIEVYYYKSTSATNLAGGSWSTTKPTWENGKYIWQKIKTTYEGKLENGQFYSESDPVNITGQQGATGTAAYSYKLNASDSVIGKTKTGEYTIDKITFTATYKQGSGAVTAYTGRFKIETTANGTTWTTQYTSSGNESSKEYTIPEDIISIRCSLYQSGGTSTLLDIVTIPIVKDGIDAVGLRDSISYYLASDKQTGVTRLDQGWTRFKPELTTEKRYLWVYYVSRYSEGDTQPELIEIKNDIVSFENHGDESPVENCVIDIEPVQDLHGYDSPWPAGGGENKLDLSMAHFNSCTLVNASTGTVKANIQNSYYGYVTIDSGFFFESLKKEILNGNPITFEVDNNYGYIISIVAFGTRSTGQTYQEAGAGNSNITTIIPSDFTSVTKVEFRFLRSNTAYTDIDTVITGLRVSYGDTATTFSPCSNICPITSFAGENIWDEEWEVGGIQNGNPVHISKTIRSKNFCPIVGGRTYYATCSRFDSGNQNSYFLAVAFYDANKSYIDRIFTNNQAFVAPNNARYFKIYTNSSIVVYGDTYNHDIAIKHPATSTDYVPYSGKGGATVHVIRTGKNLFDAQTFVSGVYCSKNFAITSSADIRSAKLYLKAGTYTLSATASSSTINRRIMNGTISYANRNLPMTFTLSADGWFGFSTVDLTSDFQLELGSTATDYKPYTGDTYSITFPSEAGTVYGGTLDIVNGKLVVDKILHTITKDANIYTWGVNYQKQGVTGFYSMGNVIYPNDYDNILKNIKCNILPCVNNNWGGSTVGVYYNKRGASTASWYETIAFDNNSLSITNSDTNETVIQKFKTLLEETPLQIVNELATPITYTLTPQEITMLTGQNHIFSDTGQTAISYYDNQTSIDPYVDYSATSAFEVAQSVSDAVGTLQAPYKEVEWVESTGKQYVYLDWKPPIKTWGFEIDFISRNAVNTSTGAWNESTNVNGYGSIFGVRNTSGVNNCQLSSYSNGLLRIGNGTTIATGFKTDHSRQTIKLQGTTVTKTDGTTATVTRVDENTAKPYCNMTVFALYQGLRCQDTGGVSEPSSTRIYSLKFYDGTTLTVDLVGAIRKADGVTGLYDKVSRHFYPAPGMLFGNEVGNINDTDTVAESLNKADVNVTVVNKNRTRMWETAVPFNRLEDGQKITVTYSYGNVVNSIETAELPEWNESTTSGNARVYLKLTYPNGNKSEWIPCYYSQTARLTSHYGAGTPITFTYHEDILSNATEVGAGAPVVRGFFANPVYDSNYYDRRLHNNSIKAKEAITAYHLICGDEEGYQNINASVSFNLGYPILYASGGIATTKTATNTYEAMPGVNFTYTGTIQNGEADKMLWLKGTVDGNTFTVAFGDFLTTVTPTMEDGMYYIPLGIMASTTTGYFSSSNRLYAYIDGAFQPVDTAAVIRAQDAKNLATAVYGTCSTAADTPLKEVVCENFILFDGVRIQVAFENANSTNVPSLNVNNTGAKQILINQAIVSESNQLLWAENAQMEFVYDGTYWVLQNAPYSLYGICSVTEEIPEKVIECAEAVICKGTTITVDFMYSNTSDNTVFNVANIAQKPLLVNGDVLKVNSRFNWHAGAIRTFYFDGQAWNMSDDIVSAYIDEYETEQDEDGIMVHPVGQKNTGWSIGSTLEMLKNGVSYIKMWFDKVEEGEFSLPFIRIGKESGNHVLVGDDAVTIREDQKELAHYSSLGITFDDETPYKIGNDTTYIAFEDTDNDAKADSLRIVADSISFHSNGTEKDLRSELEGLNENIDLNTQAIEQNAEAIENTQKYIQIDPEVPSIKLATNDRNYLLIESNKLGFWVDANETAYMSQNQMNIPTASITNLLMQTTNAETGETIGQIGWVMRTNGHLSLKIMN